MKKASKTMSSVEYVMQAWKQVQHKDCVDAELDFRGYRSISGEAMHALVDCLWQQQQRQQRNRSQVAHLHLEETILEESDMEDLMTLLENDECIQSLWLDDTCASPLEAIELASMLQFNQTLQRLSLNNNQLGDEGAICLAQGLGSNDTLRELEVAFNAIGDEGCKALAEAGTSLQSLVLEYNHVGVNGAEALAVAIANAPWKRLSLACNQLGDDGLGALADGLAAPMTCLERLDVSENGIFHRGVTSLVAALEQNDTLEELFLGNNMIGAEAIAGYLKSPRSSLRRLHMTNCRLDNEAIRSIAEALHQNKSLRFIDLGSNQIDEANDLAIMLQMNTTLTTLGMARNALPSEAIQVLAKQGLKKNSTLTELDVSVNKFDDVGVEALAEVLSTPCCYDDADDSCCGLERINLEYNCAISERSIRVMAKAAQSNPRLQECRVWFRPSDHPDMESLRFHLYLNRTGFSKLLKDPNLDRMTPLLLSSPPPLSSPPTSMATNTNSNENNNVDICYLLLRNQMQLFVQA